MARRKAKAKKALKKVVAKNRKVRSTRTARPSRRSY